MQHQTYRPGVSPGMRFLNFVGGLCLLLLVGLAFALTFGLIAPAGAHAASFMVPSATSPAPSKDTVIRSVLRTPTAAYLSPAVLLLTRHAVLTPTGPRLSRSPYAGADRNDYSRDIVRTFHVRSWAFPISTYRRTC